MRHLDLLPIVSASFCAIIAAVTLIKSRRDLAFVTLAFGMASLGFMDLANFKSLRALGGEDLLFWQKLSLMGEMLFAGNWLLFSIIFGKGQPKKTLRKWRWVLPPAYLCGTVFLILLFTSDQAMTPSGQGLIKLDTVARGFHIGLLVLVVITLVNLENTFRSSTGLDRWKIKYLLFSICAYLLFYVYILGQRLSYCVININHIHVKTIVLIIINFLIFYAILYQKVIDKNIFVSRKVIYSSVSLIAIGLYGIIISLIVQIVQSFDIVNRLNLHALLVFMALLAMVLLFYMESFRRKSKKIINRHFGKSKYVYRDEWIIFSTELSRKVTTKEVCEILSKTLYERIFAKHVSVWLMDEISLDFVMVSSIDLRKIETRVGVDDKVIRYFENSEKPTRVLKIIANKKLEPMSREMREVLAETKAEVLVPLRFANEWIGFITLGRIQTGGKYDEEDYDLLSSVAAHAASAINDARLHETNLRAKELEAFNRLSCFVIHDLKNATSLLSMVARNAREHLCNPEFQREALQSISAAVGRMKKILGSLCALPDRVVLQSRDTDLNELIQDVVEGMERNGFSEVQFERDLETLPLARLDAGEIRKVLENLLLNACEAMNGEGRIRIVTTRNEEHIVFSIRDNGPGILKEFLDDSIFQPFRTTKKNGLGIGLYQCKTIVEAHGGRIEAERISEGGSKFTVNLPIPQVRSVRPGVSLEAQHPDQRSLDLDRYWLQHSDRDEDITGKSEEAKTPTIGL